ncbi:Ig-like domain-containing protein [Cumulibacter soli]|uniref:Ig-like domain-containing protein n=1 Tax=Cumulibacter soli TaxID=2546344 RepID=UPI0010673843|nr:Ig-like domain-containing protein [Cumulibacter soli]
MFIGTTAAHADTTVITVTNLGLSGEGSLRAALEQANTSANPDGVSIVFDESLAGGTIELTGGADNSMYTEHVGNPAGQVSATIGQNGARFLVNSTVPVSIDFGGISITDIDGSATAGIYVASDNVSLSNLGNVLSAEAAIAVSGDNVAIENVSITDNESSQMEAGVALLDGADGTTISNATIQSAYWSNILVDTDATVSNTTITGLNSRGAQGYGHIIVEDGASIDGFTVSESVLGDPGEVSPQPGFYFNPGNVVSNLTLETSTFQSPGQFGFYFEGDNQTFTNTVIDGNTFGGNEGAPINRVVENSGATWDGLQFTNNDVSFAASTNFIGTVSNANFSGNSFEDIDDGGAPVLNVGNESADVTIENNTFNRNWTLDQIRISGTSATNVVIQDNDIRNLIASVSAVGIRTDAPGSGNVIQNNQLIQEIDDPTLPDHVDNHWAIYNYADAATADTEVGWSIQYNHIDGFGGKDRSQAPIVHDGTGKLPVIGNTFGPNTRGSLDPETEEGPFWFMLNRWDTLSNNTVQTYRATEVVYTGSEAQFTATAPEPEIGNNPATAPVTLHVYWTASDNAEEYLGSIEEVSPGQRVAIPTDHTDGVIRVQTVDANGYTSQYSSVDPTPPVVDHDVPAPGDIVPTEDGASGTGETGYNVVIRDADGNQVAEAEVGEDGSWSVDGLQCGTDYTAVQVETAPEVTPLAVGDESDPVEFTTADCAVETPAAPGDIVPTEDGASGTGESGATVIVRDAEGNQVAEVEVGEDGTWSVSGLECGVEYTAVQVVDEVEGDAATFTTAACDDGAGNGDDDGAGNGDDDGAGNGGDGSNAGSDDGTDGGSASGSDDGSLANTGAVVSAGVLGGAVLAVAAGTGLLYMNRRRTAASTDLE